MKLVVISPEGDDARERDVLAALFAAGLERYHLRKPHASAAQLETWLRPLPAEARARIVLHQHHELVARLGLRGAHGDDAAGLSRSCHTLGELRASLGQFDSVFFSPVFSSISKPGYAPHDDTIASASILLARRTTVERRTTVLALGGITPETAPRALALGFDGVAVLGAIWRAADPLRAFTELQNSLVCHA